MVETHFIIQDISNDQYKSSTGWTVNKTDAQLLSTSSTSSLYWRTILSGLSAGKYILHQVYVVS